MIGLANLALLGGLAAAAAPVLIHIAHQRRFKTVRWGAMLFLLDLLKARRRRLAIEHWLLLAVRCLALLLLALALCRPYFARVLGGGTAIERSGSVAAVVLVDDSLSSGAGRGDRAIDQLKRLAGAYLGTLHKGDEISILTMSRLGEPIADPLFDHDAARDIIAAIQPTAVSSDIPALLDAGLEQLARHVNPAAELVLISDGGGDGWHAEDTSRWDELRRKLSAPAGGRAQPRLVVLSPATAVQGGNLAIETVILDRSLIPVERKVGIRIGIAHYGGEPVTNALVRLSVDGRAVGEVPLTSEPGVPQEVFFEHSFSEAGSHMIEAWIEGARDQLPRDDRRTLAVEVESSVPVLLVEGTPGEKQHGSLGYVAAALDPSNDGKGLFAITRVSAASFRGEQLDHYRVVVLGDVAALDAQTVAAMEAFVVSGGGIMVAPGPATDLATVNRYWSRGGHGFLPVPWAEVVAPDPAPVPSTMSLGHPALIAFGAKSQDAWRAARVGRYIGLAADAVHGDGVERLVSLNNGAPLVLQRDRGHGRVVMFTTSLDLTWSDLPRTASFVPLVRGLVGYLASVVLPPRNLRPSERIVWLPPAGVGADTTLIGPDGTTVAIADGSWESRRALLSAPVVEPGGYTLRVPGGPTVRFAVGPEPSESRLDQVTDEALKDSLRNYPLSRFSDTETITAAFAKDAKHTVELWRYLVIGCVLLLLVETLLTRRQVGGSAPTPARAA